MTYNVDSGQTQLPDNYDKNNNDIDIQLCLW